MAAAKSAWGIDIGNRALKAIKLVRDGDRLRVDDLEVIEHEQILSTAGDNKEGLVQSALANFVQRHGTKGSIVGIAVSGQSSFARFIKLPPVEPKKIPEIVKFEAIQQIPFPLEDVEWGYQLFQDPESPDIEVGIFAMRKELVNAHIKQFTDLDMNVQVVQMGPLAIYNGMQYDDRFKSGTTMMIDCGSENTDLIIADGETVWLRTISIGGNNFTEALTKSFKLSFAKAEELKRNAATSKYQRQIFQAMRPVFADLVSEIQRSIGFYASVHREARIKRIIALGSTFRLPTLQKYLQQNLQVEVERIDGFSGGAPADGRLASTLNENLISMTTAYGLAIQAMGDAKITSSLLPEPIRKAKLWKEKIPWFGLAAACFVVGTAGVAAKWYVDDQAFHSKENFRNTADMALKGATNADAAWTKTQDEGAPDRKRIQDVLDMQSGREFWARISRDIADALPRLPADVNAMILVPRPKREQITVDSLTSEYRPNMADILAMKDEEFKRMGNAAANASQAMPGAVTAGGGTEGAPAAPASSEAPRGFLITIHCTTPNSGGSTYVHDALVSKLATALSAATAYKLDPTRREYDSVRPYYVAKINVVNEVLVKKDTNRKTVLDAAAAAGNAGAGTGGAQIGGGRIGAGRAPEDIGLGRGAVRGTGRPAPDAPPGRAVRPAPGGRPDPTRPGELDPNGKPAAPAFADPQTGEDMAEDFSLTVLVAVVLDPPPPAKDAAPAAPRASAQ